MVYTGRNAAELERRTNDQSERLDDALVEVDDEKAVGIRSLLWTFNKKAHGCTYADIRRTHGKWGEAGLLPWLLEHGFVAQVPNPDDKYISLFKSEIFLDKE